MGFNKLVLLKDLLESDGLCADYQLVGFNKVE